MRANCVLPVKQRAEANAHEKGLCARRTNCLQNMTHWMMRPAHSIILLLCALASALCGGFQRDSWLTLKNTRCRTTGRTILDGRHITLSHNRLEYPRCSAYRAVGTTTRMMLDVQQIMLEAQQTGMCLTSGYHAVGTTGRKAWRPLPLISTIEGVFCISDQ